MSMDPVDSDSSQFLSFSEGTLSSSTNTSPIPLDGVGTSSGSGDDDKPLKSWHWTEADAFIIPNDPLPKASKRFVIPKLNLTPRIPLSERDERREKIKENFGKKFVQESQKEEKIGLAIKTLEQLNLNSGKPRNSSLNTPSSSPTTRKERAFSNETLLPRSLSNPLNTTLKTPQTSLSQVTSSPTLSRDNTHVSPQPPTSLEIKKDIPQIPVTTSSTPSPRVSTSENSMDPLKNPEKLINPQGKRADTEINNISMRRLTWKDGGVALLTITGLITFLYCYWDELPTSITTKIDNLLATFRMNR